MGDVLCPVMVGRDAELRTLTDALAGARVSLGRVVFVTGEAGLGKSRLVRELTSHARTLGVAVAVGRAVPAVADPYRPLTEALLQALRRRPLPDDPGLEPWRPTLAEIVPTLGGQGQPEASAAVRGEAVIQLLERLAEPGGMVMVLEDLHWADPDTLAVIEYLGDNISEEPVLCVGTIRSESGSAALDLAGRLHGRHAAGHLVLDRLSQDQVAQMVHACLPDAGDQVVDRVRRTADGVPLLVEELLASPGRPGSFAGSVRARWAGIPWDDRLVLEVAAVLGRYFEWQLLAPATGLPPEQVAGALDRGMNAMLLSADGDGFQFRHALTREAVLGEVSPPRRAALAAAALAALEASHPRLDGRQLDVAADLAAQSGDRRRAGALLAASGRACVRRGALGTAVATLGRAIELAEEPELGEEAQKLLVEALALAGRVDEAIIAGERLIAELAERGAPAGARAEVHARLAQAAVSATRWPVASSHISAATDLLPADPPPHSPLAARLAVLDAGPGRNAWCASTWRRARTASRSVKKMKAAARPLLSRARACASMAAAVGWVRREALAAPAHRRRPAGRALGRVDRCRGWPARPGIRSRGRGPRGSRCQSRQRRAGYNPGRPRTGPPRPRPRRCRCPPRSLDGSGEAGFPRQVGPQP